MIANFMAAVSSLRVTCAWFPQKYPIYRVFCRLIREHREEVEKEKCGINILINENCNSQRADKLYTIRPIHRKIYIIRNLIISINVNKNVLSAVFIARFPETPLEAEIASLYKCGGPFWYD